MRKKWLMRYGEPVLCYIGIDIHYINMICFYGAVAYILPEKALKIKGSMDI